MASKPGFFKALRKRLFGLKQDVGAEERSFQSTKKVPRKPDIGQADVEKIRPAQRDPYFIQIGYDFGTSYSKCVCRDVMTNKSWVHMPPELIDREIPFLIPSTLLVKNSKLALSKDCSREYHQNGLYHLKLAIEKVALKQWNDPILATYKAIYKATYKKAVSDVSIDKLADFVITIGVYFLARTLEDVKNDIELRYSDFGTNKDDYIAVNLAVPVADAERPSVNELFHRVLCTAWCIADQVNKKIVLSQEHIKQLYKRINDHQFQRLRDACYIYPEVSANVQGFIRSSVSKPGIYLFSDAGAGTVDQSVFIFFRKNGEEHLTYLHGSVLPEGSSYIEKIAASIFGDSSWQNLEKWRKRKERSGIEPELQKARKEVGKGLSKGTKTTLSKASRKLYEKKQLHDIRVIFGGGGYIEHPYKTAVMKAFAVGFFPKDFLPDVVGLPIPKDLEIDGRKNRWMSRLSVAYGLSFVRTDLASNIYPKDLKDPEPSEINTTPIREIPEAPTKDVC